jgi:GNAT superfamily N-acetyltransferase
VLQPTSNCPPERLAAIQDAASTAALAHVFGDAPFPREDVIARWQDSPASIVCDFDVGFAAVDPPWLEGLYVLPEWWGTGAAERLYGKALDVLRASGIDEAHLWVIARNVRARRFYERRGWKRDSQTQVVPFPPFPTELRYTLRVERSRIELYRNGVER